MKAVIKLGSSEYLVSVGDEIFVDLLPADKKSITVSPLLLIDGEKIDVGQPELKDRKVELKVIEPVVAGEKLRVIRYKAKKRVHKEIGHRQKYTLLSVDKIA